MLLSILRANRLIAVFKELFEQRNLPVRKGLISDPAPELIKKGILPVLEGSLSLNSFNF